MPRHAQRYLAAFAPSAPYMLLSAAVEHGLASPLSAAYVPGSEHRLGVGDDEGRLHVVHTRCEPGLHAPLVHVTAPLVDGSVFALEWQDSLAALGGSDYTVHAYDMEHDACVASYDAHAGSVRALAWLSRGVLVSGGRDGDMYVWDVRQKAAAQHMPRVHAAGASRRKHAPPVTAVAALPGARIASACGVDAAVRVWDVRQPRRPCAASADLSARTPWNTRSHGVSSLALARHTLYAACTDGCIYALDAGDVERAAIPSEARALFHPVQRQNTLYARMAVHDETYLALGCHTGDVVLWDVSTRRRPTDGGIAHDGTLLRRGHAEHAEVNAVSWTHGRDDGPALASASDDLSIRVWRRHVTESPRAR